MKSTSQLANDDNIDLIVNRIQYNRLQSSPAFCNDRQSLNSKLYNVYVEACKAERDNYGLLPSVYLANKLIAKEGAASVIISLYHHSKGYAVTLRGENGKELQPIQFSYEDCELLQYLDALELPPVLANLLDNWKVPVFDNGCVIVEVRDYRCKVESSSNFESNYVILRPTFETLISDINTITEVGNWTQDEKLKLESELLLATQGPLCLDSSIDVLRVCNRLQYNRVKYNNRNVKRLVKRNSVAMKNRAALYAKMAAPAQLSLIDFLSDNPKKRSNVKFDLKIAKPAVDMWKQQNVQLSTPSDLNVEKFASKKENASLNNDSLETVQSVVFKGEKSDGRNSQLRMVITRRPIDDIYYGELCMENEGADDTDKRANPTCRFELGNLDNARRYLEQFKELITEEGRKLIKVAASNANSVDSSKSEDIPHGRISRANRNVSMNSANTTMLSNLPKDPINRIDNLSQVSTTMSNYTHSRHLATSPANSANPVIIPQSSLLCQPLPQKQILQYGIRHNMNIIASPPPSPGIQNNNIQLPQYRRVQPGDGKSNNTSTSNTNSTTNAIGRQYVISQQPTPLSPVTGQFVTGNLASTTTVSTMQLAHIAPAVNNGAQATVEARRMIQNKIILRNQFPQQQSINVPIRSLAQVQHPQQQLNVSVIASANAQPRQAILSGLRPVPSHNQGSSQAVVTNGNKSGPLSPVPGQTQNNLTCNTGLQQQPLRTSMGVQQEQIRLQQYQHKPPQILPNQPTNQSQQQQHLQQLKPRIPQSPQPIFQRAIQISTEQHVRNLGIRHVQQPIQPHTLAQQQQQQQQAAQQQIQ